MDENILKELGWNDLFAREFEPYSKEGFEPARVIAEHRERYLIAGSFGERSAEVSGKFAYTAANPSEFPKTGDWVAADVFGEGSPSIIHSVLKRQSLFSRMAAGTKVEKQVLASNVETVFVVQGLDHNYNPMRLLRYIASLRNEGLKAVILLNKSDLNPEAGVIAEKTAALIPGVEVRAISAAENRGLEELKKFMGPGRTFVFTGSSGVGKSTILNALLGRQEAGTREVRQDDSRGRHTTVARQLYRAGESGLIIDTPGIRELQLWSESGEIEEPGIISEYAEKCRFKDCAHESEPGCAVREAIERGEIPPEAVKSHRKIKREAEFAASKIDEKSALERKKREKKFGRMVKEIVREKKSRGRKA